MISNITDNANKQEVINIMVTYNVDL